MWRYCNDIIIWFCFVAFHSVSEGIWQQDVWLWRGKQGNTEPHMERISLPETASLQCAIVFAYNWKLLPLGSQRCRKILRHMLRQQRRRKKRFYHKNMVKFSHRFVVLYGSFYPDCCFYMFSIMLHSLQTTSPILSTFLTSLHYGCSMILGRYLHQTVDTCKEKARRNSDDDFSSARSQSTVRSFFFSFFLVLQRHALSDLDSCQFVNRTWVGGWVLLRW